VDEMNCDELVERVTDFLEDALGADDQARLDDHRHECYGCRNYLSEVHATLQLVSSLSGEQISDELESALLSQYRVWAERVG
jgi:hypothetical protein